jgi:hypothetical protein
MTRHLLTLALAALATSLSGPAGAQLVPVEWDTGGQFVKEMPVPAGKFVEVCEKLSKGTTVEWTFDATAPLDFNVHYHEGKKVLFPAKQDQAAKGSGKLAVKLDQDYCWMWSSKAATDTTLKLVLKRS